MGPLRCNGGKRSLPVFGHAGPGCCEITCGSVGLQTGCVGRLPCQQQRVAESAIRCASYTRPQIFAFFICRSLQSQCKPQHEAHVAMRVDRAEVHKAGDAQDAQSVSGTTRPPACVTHDPDPRTLNTKPRRASNPVRRQAAKWPPTCIDTTVAARQTGQRVSAT